MEGSLPLMTQHMYLHLTIPSRCSTSMKGQSQSTFAHIAWLSSFGCSHCPSSLPPSTLFFPFVLSPMHSYRYQCGVAVIIEGETGVGKTALVEMLSKLWNYATLVQWNKQCSRLLDFMRRKLGDISVDVSNSYQACPNLHQAPILRDDFVFENLRLV